MAICTFHYSCSYGKINMAMSDYFFMEVLHHEYCIRFISLYTLTSKRVLNFTEKRESHFKHIPLLQIHMFWKWPSGLLPVAEFINTLQTENKNKHQMNWLTDSNNSIWKRKNQYSRKQTVLINPNAFSLRGNLFRKKSTHWFSLFVTAISRTLIALRSQNKQKFCCYWWRSLEDSSYMNESLLYWNSYISYI